MIKKLLLFVTVLTSLSALAATPDEVKTKLTAKYPDVHFLSVNATPAPGIFEVQVDPKSVMYTEATGEYFFPTMVEMKTRRNLGKERGQELSKISFNDLPLKDAIKVVRGDGKRTMAIFSDPDCPYCKTLETSVVALDNVTMYVFPFPLTSLHPGARDKAISIWCASNPAELWSRTLISGQAPKSAQCDNPIDRNIELAKRLNIFGTPALIFSDGTVVPGAIPFDQIEANLQRAG